MSLNKLSNTDIKPYLNLGCNTLNCLFLKQNGTDIYPTNTQYRNVTMISSNGTISNATAYVSTNRGIMTMNVRALLSVATDSSSIFITLNLPLLIAGDETKEANCVGTITGSNNNSLISKQCILQTNTKLYSQYCSLNPITVGDSWINAVYQFAYL
jgi:hypothetical protein